MELKVKLKKMGNSLGIIIPSDLVRSKGFREGEDLSIDILRNKFSTVGDILEEARKQKLKFTKSTEEIMRETDKDLEQEMFEDE